MLHRMNYLQIFELPPTCTLEEISVKYKVLAKKYHPDRPTGNEEKMKLVNAAYDFAQKNHRPMIGLNFQDVLLNAVNRASQMAREMQQRQPAWVRTTQNVRSKDGRWESVSTEHFYRIIDTIPSDNTIYIDLPIKVIEFKTTVHCMIKGLEITLYFDPPSGEKDDLVKLPFEVSDVVVGEKKYKIVIQHKDGMRF